MDELIPFAIGFFGGALASYIVVNRLNRTLEKKIADIRVQLFALRIELNKWNDDSSNV